MYDLAKLGNRIGRMGEPLPDPFHTFADNRVTFRRGATSMIAGQPGTFKSVLALNMLVTWAQAGCTALYFSADSDESTVGQRVAGILSGDPQPVVERSMLAGHPFERDYAPAIRDILSPVARMEYRAMDAEQVAGRLHGFEHAYGSYPDVVFVDNLINYAPSSTDWGAMIDFQNELDSMAREFKSHVVVLHHASESWPRGVPLPAQAIQGKVNQIPRMVLTTACQDNSSGLMVACVKNTKGPQFPNAIHHMNFYVEPSMRITDLDHAELVGR